MTTVTPSTNSSPVEAGCRIHAELPTASGRAGALDGNRADLSPNDRGKTSKTGESSNSPASHAAVAGRYRHRPDDEKSGKPTIHVTPGKIHDAVRDAEIALARSGKYFQRGGRIVQVTLDPHTNDARAYPVGQSALIHGLSAAADWTKYSETTLQRKKIDPPQKCAAILHDLSTYEHLPVLKGIARQPYLRPDGTLMMQAGYDPTTMMYGAFDASEFTIPEVPTRKDAEAALAELESLLSEFQFAARYDLTATLTAILTAAIRPSLSLAPMVHVRAHAPGSGKSCLCELTSAFATSRRNSPTTFPSDDDECRKLLLAEYMGSPAVIEFDNLTTDILPHNSLCAALTSEFISGRILGSLKTVSVNTRTMLLSSGNNVGPIQDMARRCVTITLDPACEAPAMRSFKRPDLVQYVLRKRGHFVSLAFTIILAWIRAGRPMSAQRPLAGFSEWSDLCRQPIAWLTGEDPASSIFEGLNQDPDRELLDRLLTSWHEEFGSRPARVREAVAAAQAYGDTNVELREVIHEIAGERAEINRKKFGWWLRKHVGRLVNGRKFVRAQHGGSAEAWAVVSA
ncbi:hypothetical protein [Parvibaculum sp.]|uniref:hypothetical protein n=1 Tax=Parvibaculum sp. TaxID=2024848 RepID=UPI00320E3AC7